MSSPIDVQKALKELTITEKVQLLAGKDTWSTHSIDRLNIPSITTTDGPHGARGTAFFNGPPGAFLPSATAMGATFDRTLMRSVGEMLASETKERGCNVLLAPTVCLQRSPLIGRGFEAFGEDPVLSGLMASEYINGVQEHGVGVSIKHYAAHDQSWMTPEDDVVASERTLREMHLLPFQLAVKHANPWSFMSSYHRINGVHTSEDPWLNNHVLRSDWGWDGLVMTDWFGLCSTAESINAGVDLEMPGPTRWRGQLLHWALMSRKVNPSTVDKCVRNLLSLINKVQPSLAYTTGPSDGNTKEKRDLCRQVSRDSIVLLKNEQNVLPLQPTKTQTYGLIGPGFFYPVIGGGGSADLTAYYISKPYDAIKAVVGADQVKAAIGCYSHLYTPLLVEHVTVPEKDEPGYLLKWYGVDPDEHPEATCLHTTTTTQAQMYFADSLPSNVPPAYWLRVRTTFMATKTTSLQLGLCVIGKGRLFVDGKEEIDLWTSQPDKTHPTPMFNQASPEVVAEISVVEGKAYDVCIQVRNESVIPGVGALSAGGLRVGCCEKIDPVAALAEAVELAKSVDVPIVIAGLNADYESEAMDRTHLDLPPGVDNLIERVAQANPKTVIVTQAGCPFVMPWIDNVPTLVHAWFGGQETGNAIADVLFGRHSPSGRLTVTFPRRLEDTPAFLNFGKGTRQLFYGEGVFLGYRYYEKLRKDPLFYFGYGLSYSTFEYSNLRVPDLVTLKDDDNSFTLLVDVTNTGSHDGFEIVQIYIQDIECASLRPCKELKGFSKVWIAQGQIETVKVTLDKYALSYWDEAEEKWHAEKGAFNVIIARSANPTDKLLEKRFVLSDSYFWEGI